MSHDVAEFSARSGLPRQKLEVIPNGVDVDRFAKAAPADLAQFGLPRDVRVAVCVGRLDRQKGLDGLLEHAQSLLEPGSVHLLFVGDGPERAQLEQMARAIPGRVHFAGYADRVPEILAASDMLLLPSRWEGMPNVVLEAMAAGKPVVAFDVEGVAELLGPNAHEQVVARGDYSGFAKTALRFADDAALAQKLGAANRRRAEAEFSTRLMVKCYEELWARAMIE